MALQSVNLSSSTGKHAEEEIEHVVFEVHFLYMLTQNAYKFLQQIPSQINNLDVSVECCVAEEKTDK